MKRSDVPVSMDEANKREARVKPRSGGRGQAKKGTSEIRRMLIGRELFNETK
jgi:hypothetical protein